MSVYIGQVLFITSNSYIPVRVFGIIPKGIMYPIGYLEELVTFLSYFCYKKQPTSILKIEKGKMIF